MARPVKEEIRNAFYDYLDGGGVSKADFRKRFPTVSGATLLNWEKQKSNKDEAYDSNKFLEERDGRIDAALIAACEKGSPKALELFFKLRGKLVDKVKADVTIGLSADEIARRNLQAERDLRDAGYGVAEVQDKPLLLP